MGVAPGRCEQARAEGEAGGNPVRLRAWLRCMPLLLVCAGALGQVADAGPAEHEAQRARIAAERARADQRFAAEEIACQQRFAVTGCVEKARAAQRAVHADLQRQEVLLNDAERRRKAQEQRRRLEDKQRERAADAASRATRAPPAPGELPSPSSRLPAPPKPATSDAQQVAEHEARMRSKRAAHEADQARRADLAAKAGDEERRYAERQREAAEYKARILRRNAASGAARPAPLPAPP